MRLPRTTAITIQTDRLNDNNKTGDLVRMERARPRREVMLG